MKNKYSFPILFGLAIIALIGLYSCSETLTTENSNAVSGQILDQHGLSIINAVVELYDGSSSVYCKDTTGDNGEFTLSSVPSNISNVKLKITDTDFKPYEDKLINVIQGKDKQNLKLKLLSDDSCCGEIILTVKRSTDSLPLDSAIVYLRRGSQNLRRGVTDSAGRIIFANVCAGEYSFYINKSGYTPYSSSDLNFVITHCDTIRANEYMTVAQTDTCCNGVLKVFLIDSLTGRYPTTGPSVSLLLNGNVIQTYRCTGSYVYFSRICPGNYQVRVSSNYYYTKTWSYTSHCNSFDTITKLIDPNGYSDSCCHGKITVFVKDSITNSNIDSATIYLSQNNTTIATGTTSYGKYQFTGLCSGTYSVYIAGKTGWTRCNPFYWNPVTLNCNDSVNFTGYMYSASICCHGKIAITVRDSATNNSIDSVQVVLSKNNTTIATGYTTSGKYLFTGLCPGTYSVYVASKSGWMRCNPYSFSTTMVCNDSVNFTDYMVSAGACCHGKITVFVQDSVTHGNLDSVPIYLSLNGTSYANGTTSYGKYQFTGLCPGTYSIYIGGKTGWTRCSPFSFSSIIVCNDSLNYTGYMYSQSLCCHGKIDVTVIDSTTGNTIDSCYVGLSKNGALLTSLYTVHGKAEFTGLCPGVYSLYYTKSGWYRPESMNWSDTLACNDSAGFRKTMIQSSLCCLGTITGTVTDTTSGSPIPNATLHLYYNNNSYTTVYSDNTGHFQFTGLCAGTYAIAVDATNYAHLSIYSIVLQCNDTSHVLSVFLWHN